MSKTSTSQPKASRGHDHDHGGGEHSHGSVFGEGWEIAFAALSAVTLAFGWGVESALGKDGAVTIYLAAYFFGGFFTVIEAVENLRHRKFEIDTLMIAAAIGAGALGHWSEGALLLALFSIGHALENYAMGRARKAIEALGKLAPDIATVRRGSGTEEIRTEDIRVGDIAIVKPNERLPADGLVVVGESSVDQSSVTGESVPVDKRPFGTKPQSADDFTKAPAEVKVFAGTINGPSPLEIWVAKPAQETTLARVVKLVAEAQAERSPAQQFTEKVERIFVPSVLVCVALLMFAWVVIDEPFSASFYRAMAVLVAASPCALAISVPSAVLSGIARAGRGGVLIKGGGPLENLGTLKAIAFDKTGTLTEGKPKLTDVVAAEGQNEIELLRIAVAIEQLSDHPLAAAVARDGLARLEDKQLPKAEAVEALTGAGVKAKIDGRQVWIVKPAFDHTDGPAFPDDLRKRVEGMEGSGRTVVVVRREGEFLGLLGIMDTPRPEAGHVIQRLKGLGVGQMIMLTGDNQRVAETIAKQVGLTDARGASERHCRYCDGRRWFRCCA
jgi:Cd2+/Zn2+-exporting ATPase